MHTDVLLYRLFQERPATLFELAGLPHSGAGYQLTAVEIKEAAFRLDGILLPPAGAPAQDPAVFLENQFQWVPQFYARWLAAIFLFLYRHALQRRWVAVVVFPTRAAEPPLGAAFSALEPAGLLRRLYLEDLLRLHDPASLSIGARLLRLVVVAAADLPAEARDLADTARTESDPFPLFDLIETILVYKLPNLSRDEIKAMLHLSDTDLKQTRFYREVFAEGRDEGRDEGREAGRIETQRQTALNLLRLTGLDDAAITAVTGLDADAVAALRRAASERSD